MIDVAIDPARIRDRAHALWLLRGCAGGSAERDWLEAERAIVAEEAARLRSPADVAAPPVAAPPVAAPPVTRARGAARPRISPSAAVPPTAALSPSARSGKAKVSTPVLARPASELTKPARAGGGRSSDTRAARPEREVPPRGTTTARARKGSKAAPGTRAKRTS